MARSLASQKILGFGLFVPGRHNHAQTDMGSTKVVKIGSFHTVCTIFAP
ncbi:MAG: hypothetical protein ACLPJJ_00105 [Acidocella sp.]